ncbi:MAG: hypothetical protein ACLUDY_04900 [Bacteroides xylanisolvens]
MSFFILGQSDASVRLQDDISGIIMIRLLSSDHTLPLLNRWSIDVIIVAVLSAWMLLPYIIHSYP